MQAIARIANAMSCACHIQLVASEISPTRIAAKPSQSMNTPGNISSSSRNTAASTNQFQEPSEANQFQMPLPMTISRQLDMPVPGTVGLRAGGILPLPSAPVASVPNVDLAISAMPASEPST